MFDTYGGWEGYDEHWRYFFDCMLAPVAKQAAAALEKLPVSAAPRAAFGRPEDFVASLTDMWNAALRGMAGVSAKCVRAAAPRRALRGRRFGRALAAFGRVRGRRRGRAC